jgi:signal transduction histidine kinase
LYLDVVCARQTVRSGRAPEKDHWGGRDRFYMRSSRGALRAVAIISRTLAILKLSLLFFIFIIFPLFLVFFFFFFFYILRNVFAYRRLRFACEAAQRALAFANIAVASPIVSRFLPTHTLHERKRDISMTMGVYDSSAQ